MRLPLPPGWRQAEAMILRWGEHYAQFLPATGGLRRDVGVPRFWVLASGLIPERYRSKGPR